MPKRFYVYAFLLGACLTLVCQAGCDFVQRTNRHIEAIEEYLSSHPIPQLMAPPQMEPSHPQSHNGELSQPQHWKV